MFAAADKSQFGSVLGAALGVSDRSNGPWLQARPAVELDCVILCSMKLKP
jgi:hypothetical protein